MRKGNALIIGFCGFVALAEVSAPGQLTFAFPFLTAPKEHLAKAPAAFTKVQQQTMERMEQAEPATTAQPEQSPTVTPSPSPSPDSILSEEDRKQLKNILSQ